MSQETTNEDAEYALQMRLLHSFEKDTASTPSIENKSQQKTTKIDQDGTELEWDEQKKAWIPNHEFVETYKLNFGVKMAVNEELQKWKTYILHANSQNKAVARQFEEYTDEQWKAYINSDSFREWYTNLQPSNSLANSDAIGHIDVDQPQHKQNLTNTISSAHKQTEAHTNTTQLDNAGDAKDNVSLVARKRRRRKPADIAWHEVDQTNSRWVYVAGLPLDMDDDEFERTMSKCGIICERPPGSYPLPSHPGSSSSSTSRLQCRLYRDETGRPKGDGKCCFVKPESVELAFTLLDGAQLRPGSDAKISVSRCVFRPKENFKTSASTSSSSAPAGGSAPLYHKRKWTKKEMREFREKQERRLEWTVDEMKGIRQHREKLVILKNVFDVEEMRDNPDLSYVLERALRVLMEKHGRVRKVKVYDLNPEAVCSVSFTQAEEADLAISQCHGRVFRGRELHAEQWDGVTAYKIEETEEEFKLRQKKRHKMIGHEEEEGGDDIDVVMVAANNDKEIEENAVESTRDESVEHNIDRECYDKMSSEDAEIAKIYNEEKE